jgi:hypothetical protein
VIAWVIEPAGAEVDVGPAQSEELPAAQPGGRGEVEQDVVAAL